MRAGILQFLGGLGFFLFGMIYLEQAVSSFSNGGFKNLLKRFTSSVLKSFWSGILITILLQSSSVVSVLVLAFVGTGILSLTSALAVILGSSVGTMIATGCLGIIGLSLNVSIVAFPLIFIGAVGINFFSHWGKIVSISKFFLSLGLIFLAFSFMKEGLEFLTTMDITGFASMSPWIFALLGVVLSMLVQSGSLIFIISLTAISTGVLSPTLAFAIAFGTYVGSTMTIILGAIGKNRAIVKKQVAIWHVGFNLVVTLVGMLGLPFFVRLYSNYMEPLVGSVIGFTLIYALLRTILAIVFIPLVSPVSKLLKKIKDSGDREIQLAIHQLIHVNDLDPAVTLFAIKQDMLLLFWNAIKYNLNAWNFSISSVDNALSTEEALASTLSFEGKFDKNDLTKTYHDVKYIQNQLLEFLIELPISDKSSENTMMYQSVIAVSDSCKTIKDVRSHIEEWQWSSSENLQKDYDDMRKLVLTFYSAVLHLYQNFGSKKAITEAQETLEIVQRENDDYLAEFRPHKNDDISLTAIIQTRRYFSQSCKDLLRAMESFHLNPDEVKHFKETAVPFMK